MALAMPGPERLPPGPVRDLVEALHDLYRAAGKPGVRQLSSAIRARNDLRDTVSHETVSALLRGDSLPKWVKVECVVRQLAHWSVSHLSPDTEVRRFHGLWLRASDALTGASPATGLEPTQKVVRHVPSRNPAFTGRDGLLAAIRAHLGDQTAVVVLHGLAGVGKTQLAIEYIHRYADEYDVEWWVPAEQPPLAVAAIAALGERLDLPAGINMQQSARAVLTDLEAANRRWLLVFDNVGRKEDVLPLIPDGGGHVIVTTRDPAWTDIGTHVEVDVFARPESVEHLRSRGHEISYEEADLLAEKLGDLPLALAQVAAMQSVTRMPVTEYLQLFTEHLGELLATGLPSRHGMTVVTSLNLAFGRLRNDSPAAAQLLELLAFLGPEPVSLALLRIGGDGVVSPQLNRALTQPRSLETLIRTLRRYGLVKVDSQDQRVQVHRLVQLVLRDGLDDDARRRGKSNAQHLLAAASPGRPDDPLTWSAHAEISPHVLPADLISAEDVAVRRVVLDQARYLYRTGDLEGSRRLCERALNAWSVIELGGVDDAGHELAPVATRHLALALYDLGHYEESQRLAKQALDDLRHSAGHGDDHPDTLATRRLIAANLRITGEYEEALATDEETLQLYRRRYGEEHASTLQAMNNLAVNLRMTGDFAEAHRIDSELVALQRRKFGDVDPRILLYTTNLARDLYGLGRYREALQTQREAWDLYRDQLGSRHTDVLLAARVIAIALGKLGRYPAAVARARENYHDSHSRFGPDHQHTLAATMTYANILRASGRAAEAHSLATEAVGRYRRRFGARNPLTLAAATNLGVILRALDQRREARQVDQTTYDHLRTLLSVDHPYTICAALGLANDLALAREHGAARTLSELAMLASRQRHPMGHPDTAKCELNHALDLLSIGEETAATSLRRAALTTFSRLLGEDHPDVAAAKERQRMECDVEPPPT